MFSDLLKIVLQQRMDFVPSEAWARRLKAFSEGQTIPRTSLGEQSLMLSDLVKTISQEHVAGVVWRAFRFWRAFMGVCAY